jgi:iron complex outermembrane receptor protein
MSRCLLIVATAAQTLGTGILKSADYPGTNVPALLPSITVIGTNIARSLTSPSATRSVMQKSEIPGGFTVKTTEDMKQGRSSNFQDLLQGVPGLFLQSENGMEISKVSMRGSGIGSADEPIGVEFLLDGISFNQGDGEAIIEDFDVSTLNYAELFRGADAFKFGSLTLGGAINLVPKTGYDAPEFEAEVQGGSYGFLRAQLGAGGGGRAMGLLCLAIRPES